MSRHRHFLIAAMAAIMTAALAGCAHSSAESESLFLLQQPDNPAQTQHAAQGTQAERPVLLLDAVNLAAYLTHGGIVYQAGPNRIAVAANNRWAAPLATQLSTGLYRTLNNGLSAVEVRQADAVHAIQPVYRLHVNIDQFQGRYDGKAIISGSWRLLDTDHQIAGHGDFEQAVPLRTDGYPELVRALSQGWQQVESRLLGNITQALQQQMRD